MKQEPVEVESAEVEPVEEEQLEPVYEDYSPPIDYSDYKEPITKQTELDNKIITSYGSNKVYRIKPRIVQTKIAVPYINEVTGKPKMFKGVLIDPDTGEKVLVKAPLLRKITTLNLLDPKKPFDTEQIDFPIKQWFNDSLTSTYLEPREASFIRKLTDYSMYLFIKQVNNLSEDYTGMLWRLSFIKDIITDTGKSINGRGIEAAKTNINRNESQVWQHNVTPQAVEEFQKKKDAGLMNSLSKFGSKVTL